MYAIVDENITHYLGCIYPQWEAKRSAKLRLATKMMNASEDLTAVEFMEELHSIGAG